jgi:hypothetical protein
MQQFIPFEDDWDALENLRPEDLIPYHSGLLQPAGRPVSSVPAGFPGAGPEQGRARAHPAGVSCGSHRRPADRGPSSNQPGAEHVHSCR